MNARALLSRFLTYGGVGLVGTAAHYLLLLVLVEGFRVVPYRGAIAGFLLGGVINYFLNHRITFRSERRHRSALPQFLGVAAVGMLLTGVLVDWGTRQLHLHYFVAQMLATGLLLLFTFVANSCWTFRARG